MERNETIRQTLIFFKDKEQSVHITLKSGSWYNGKIVIINNDSLVLNEEKFGQILVLYERIKDDGIVPREEKI